MTRLYNHKNLIALTTGDVRGVGLEVSIKALLKLSLHLKKEKALVFLFRSRKIDSKQNQLLQKLDQKYSRLSFNDLDDALLYLNSLKSKNGLPANALIDLALNSGPAEWVLEASLACECGLIDSLVTGPLSKKETVRLSGAPIGHTGIFRKLFPKNIFHMAFVGKSFHVVLATDHIPLSKVEGKLKEADFRSALKASVELKEKLKLKEKTLVLGLNPHAGENNIIGDFEIKMQRILNKYKNSISPLFVSPDAAFLKKNWSSPRLFLALYHDQGLIPFKMHHGQDSGVHLTLGLPFVRTSVDHGTAPDLYNKNLANPNSMLDAIKLNLQLIGDQYV